MSTTSQFPVILPAAGIGKRMQSDIPKQYLVILGKTIIEHTITSLLSHPNVSYVVIVLSSNDTIFQTLPLASNPRVKTTLGGKERADSVLAGLQYLSAQEKWVLVHDAARPCLKHDDLSNLLALTKSGETGGILASPVRDTMKRGDSNGTIAHTESRDNLWHALTPQLFPLQQLKSALIEAQQKHVPITDEASAIEFVNQNVLLVEGSASNIKVTKPEDLMLAEFYLSQQANQAHFKDHT
ncbi:2-C-methyl-D-erythritol 4-phosphate cytidylyltransferase [Paraglaciecola aquimarina]|uniref:2-C-methyl-D-erythritol 4-phosphate cytidylyltransferase n=1 Tax=Paraglaciecola aquimarina TaxID=1235557 RepID=A0ABU3SV45_9ALTE|nr:2-C-methyl-D-erythritol 4-phosphate cytidylyltransferase [Paraglaciecola aquimarina]MDU0353858.1 2-C-methyl-D-erythritol 4-phosphate cytidylyltransferase [Paraglaciecola aquimarina]